MTKTPKPKKPRKLADGKPDLRDTAHRKDITKNADGSTDQRIGQKHWMARASSGRKAMYTDPDQLWADILEYFEWNEQNPFTTFELVKHQGNARNVEVKKRRPLTIRGLCIFLGMSHESWLKYTRKESPG